LDLLEIQFINLEHLQNLQLQIKVLKILKYKIKKINIKLFL